MPWDGVFSLSLSPGPRDVDARRPEVLADRAPLSSPQELSIAIGRGAVSLLLPKTIDVSSPAFKQAAITCQLGRDHVSVRERRSATPCGQDPETGERQIRGVDLTDLMNTH